MRIGVLRTGKLTQPYNKFFYFIIQIHLFLLIKNNFHLLFLKVGLLLAIGGLLFQALCNISNMAWVECASLQHLLNFQLMSVYKIDFKIVTESNLQLVSPFTESVDDDVDR